MNAKPFLHKFLLLALSSVAWAGCTFDRYADAQYWAGVKDLTMRHVPVCLEPTDYLHCPAIAGACQRK